MSTHRLPPELGALYHAFCEHKPREQATYVSLDPRTRAAVDMLIDRGLVKIVNAVPRPVAEVDRALSPVERRALELADDNGHVTCEPVGRPAEKGRVSAKRGVAGSTFSALARAGLLTHDEDGMPDPGFDAWVEGSLGYLTYAGRVALKRAR